MVESAMPLNKVNHVLPIFSLDCHFSVTHVLYVWFLRRYHLVHEVYFLHSSQFMTEVCTIHLCIQFPFIRYSDIGMVYRKWLNGNRQ